MSLFSNFLRVYPISFLQSSILDIIKYYSRCYNYTCLKILSVWQTMVNNLLLSSYIRRHQNTYRKMNCKRSKCNSIEYRLLSKYWSRHAVCKAWVESLLNENYHNTVIGFLVSISACNLILNSSTVRILLVRSSSSLDSLILKFELKLSQHHPCLSIYIM